MLMCVEQERGPENLSVPFFYTSKLSLSAFLLHHDFLWYLSLIRPLQGTEEASFFALCRAKASVFPSLPPAHTKLSVSQPCVTVAHPVLSLFHLLSLKVIPFLLLFLYYHFSRVLGVNFLLMHGFNLPGLAQSLINFFPRANRYKFIFIK